MGIISSIILMIIILPVTVWLLLMVPSIQNYAAHKASEWVSRKLETTVSIDRVDLKLINRAEVTGFYVEDYNGDTLIYAGSAGANINSMALLRGKFMLGDVFLRDAAFQIIQNADSTTNLKQVLDRLKREEPRDRPPFSMQMATVEIENMSFVLRKHDIREREYGINFDDFGLRNINISGSNVAIYGDSITMNLKELSLREKSGFAIKNLSSGFMSLSGRGITLDRCELSVTGSEVHMDYITFKSETWQDFGDFVEKIEMSTRIRNSKIGFETVAYFAPTMKEWKTEITNLNATLDGSVTDMAGELLRATMNDTELSVQYALKGIPDINNTRFMLNSLSLTTNSSDIDRILNEMAGVTLSDSMVVRLANLQDITLEGNFMGTISNFSTEATISSALGGAELNLAFLPGSGSHNTLISGNISADQIELGKILDKEKFGKVSVSANVNGEMSTGEISATTKATINRFDFNDYTYSNIAIQGLISNRNFVGEIQSGDENLHFDFNGMLDFNDSIPNYDFDLHLYNADLEKLNFNNRDSISWLRCNIYAAGSGFQPDHLNADIVIDELTYANHVDTLNTGKIKLIGRNNEESKYLAMRSEFMDADFRSKLSYRKLYDYAANTLYQYLPSLSEEQRPHEKLAVGTGVSSIDNYSLLSVNVKHVDNISKIFMPGLVVAEGSKLHFMFNPETEKFSLTFNSDYIERNNMFISNLDINSLNQADSISLYVRAEEFYISGFLVPSLALIAGIRENQINATTHFADISKERSALIGVTATLGRDSLSGIPNMSIRTTPSSIRQGSQSYNVFGRATMDSTKIVVNYFGVESAGQLLRANGIASTSKTDTLHINLSNFDLSVLTQFTENRGYSFTGKINGHADIASAKKDGLMHGNILFDSVTVNNIKVPDANFESTWDFERERARFLLTERSTADTVLRAYYRPADGRYMGQANIRSLDISLLDPLFSGILRGTKGSADAQIEISGVKNDIKLNGDVDINDMSTTIDFLNVQYSVPSGRLTFADNVLSMKNGTLYDPLGNSAAIAVNVDMRSFSNITYDISVTPAQLQVMNTTNIHNDMFYGRVYATGNAHIRGDKRGVNMEIAATTSGASEFYMVLDDKSDISEADFVTFVAPAKIQADSSDFNIRKQMIMDRFSKRAKEINASNMNIDMTLNVQPDLAFNLIIDPLTGHSLMGRGTGTLTMHLNPVTSDFSMIGDYEISEGIYTFNLNNIIEKPFVIESGSYIQWTGEPMDAMLNISALYRLKTSLKPIMDMAEDENSTYNVRVPVDCKIMLTDRLSQPSISFNITAPTVGIETQSIIANMLNTQEMMATQFFFLLATGSFYADGTGTTSIGASTGSATAFEFLSNQLSNWISSDTFNIGIRYQPKSEITSDEVWVDFSQGFFNDRFLIEVEGNYDAQNNTTTMNNNTKNLTGDFYLTWLIDQSGGLKAKVFSRTIDRFDENQGLQENGFGIYYNEYFNSYKDILRNFRDRFTGQRRRKEREAQKQADIIEEMFMQEEDMVRFDDTQSTGSMKADSPNIELPPDNTTEIDEPAEDASGINPADIEPAQESAGETGRTDEDY